MSMFTKDYWKTFSSYGNITNETLSESGPTAKKTNGDSYSEQDGHSVSVQNGNKNTLQVGVSNSLTYGFSFSTLGGASFSTTVGAALSNQVGLKWGMFVGPEMSINSAATVKVTKGVAYAFDTVTKCETAAQEVKSNLKTTEAHAALLRTIGQEISTFAQGVTQTVGGNYDLACLQHSVTANTALTQGVSVGINAVENLALQGNKVGINAVSQLLVAAAGRVVINAGGILQLG
jgi:hypothetical protein